MRVLPRLSLAINFVLAINASVIAAPDADQPGRQRAYCNLVKTCQVADRTGACTEQLSAPVAGVELDQAYCGWVRSFDRKGVLPTLHPDATEMWQYMGTKFHVMYVVADTVPMNPQALDLMMRNIPVAAKLVNAYRGTEYTAEFPVVEDSSFFKGTNGKSLRGRARQLWEREDHRERIYYGQGRVQILSWKLTGNLVIEFRSWPLAGTPGKTCYSARFTMFPSNSLINSVMNMGMFRSVAVGKIQEVLDDVMKASQDYASGQLATGKVEFSPEEKQVLDRFENLMKKN
ncbi:MAG: hypothetical protein IPK50_15850 [Fibrobacterota bacterium]|nr:hypothetical protein [Fibrobacterota bacterium]QQS03764.1 MAG: hypothetical protein IPK50_15850 [Fibrobacterota bacterium]